MNGLPQRREAAKVWDENSIAREVVDSALRLHRELGPGLLINFNAPLLKDGIIRIVNGLEDDPSAKNLRASAPSRED
ncbi:MAG: hypothetical protein NTV93_10280 [Verrucomicrobia bacterium]|nr:hypothetical protein [Verrucomicrobiota bacterium]